MTHTDERIEEILNDFDKKFSKIVHMHRGECVITDSTGTEFQAHTDENGKVTEVGGLESIKDFIRAHLTTFAVEIRKERVEHCDDINCPECSRVAYEAGVKAERERAKTVDDLSAYLSPDKPFVCPFSCGVMQTHTHPGGNVKKVFIRHD